MSFKDISMYIVHTKYRHPTDRNLNFVQHLDLGSLPCLTPRYQCYTTVTPTGVKYSCFLQRSGGSSPPITLTCRFDGSVADWLLK